MFTMRKNTFITVYGQKNTIRKGAQQKYFVYFSSCPILSQNGHVLTDSFIRIAFFIY